MSGMTSVNRGLLAVVESVEVNLCRTYINLCPPPPTCAVENYVGEREGERERIVTSASEIGRKFWTAWNNCGSFHHM